MQQQQHRPSQQQLKPEAEIDQTPLAFKDIRARFQQDDALPIRNQQASFLVEASVCFRDINMHYLNRPNTELPYH